MVLVFLFFVGLLVVFSGFFLVNGSIVVTQNVVFKLIEPSVRIFLQKVPLLSFILNAAASVNSRLFHR